MSDNEQLEEILRKLLAIANKTQLEDFSGEAGGNFTTKDDPSQVEKLNTNLEKFFDPNGENSIAKRINDLVTKFTEYKGETQNNNAALTQAIQALNAYREEEKKERVEKQEKERIGAVSEVKKDEIESRLKPILEKYDVELDRSKGKDAATYRDLLDSTSAFDKEFKRILKEGQEATRLQQEYVKKNLGKTEKEIETEEKNAREKFATETRKKIQNEVEELLKDTKFKEEFDKRVNNILKIVPSNTPIAATAKPAEVKEEKGILGSTIPVAKLPYNAPTAQELAQNTQQQSVALFKVSLVDIDKNAYDKLRDLYKEITTNNAADLKEAIENIKEENGDDVVMLSSGRSSRPGPISRTSPAIDPKTGKPISKIPAAANRVTAAAKALGPAAVVVGGLYAASETYEKTGSASQALTTGVVAGAGGYGGAVAGAKLGALAGAAGGPVGIAVGSIIGGLIGGIAGSTIGKKISDTAFDAFKDKNEEYAKEEAEKTKPNIQPDTTVTEQPQENANKNIAPGNTPQIDLEEIKATLQDNSDSKELIQVQNNYLNELTKEVAINQSEDIKLQLQEGLQGGFVGIKESLAQSIEAVLSKYPGQAAASNNTTVIQGGNNVGINMVPPSAQEYRESRITRLSGER